MHAFPLCPKRIPPACLSDDCQSTRSLYPTHHVNHPIHTQSAQHPLILFCHHAVSNKGCCGLSDPKTSTTASLYKYALLGHFRMDPKFCYCSCWLFYLRLWWGLRTAGRTDGRTCVWTSVAGEEGALLCPRGQRQAKHLALSVPAPDLAGCLPCIRLDCGSRMRVTWPFQVGNGFVWVICTSCLQCSAPPKKMFSGSSPPQHSVSGLSRLSITQVEREDRVTIRGLFPFNGCRDPLL